MIKKIIKLGVVISTALLLTVSCEEDEDDPAAAMLTLYGLQTISTTVSDADKQEVITNYVNNVVLPIYKSLDTAAESLKTTTATLKSSPTEANVTAVRDAWKSARIAWENSEAFLFGPVDTNGYDPRIDSWPLDKTDLDKAIAAKNYNVTSLSDSVRGFHTVEYLAFDDGGGSGGATEASTLANLGSADSDKLTFLAALASDIDLVTGELYDSWDSSSGNYAGTFTTAGDSSNTTYPSLDSAIEEMLRGMDTIVDEVRSGKISEPYTETNVEKVESRYAYNSLVDFANNIRGVQYVWTGDYNGNTGKGLDEIIAIKNATLATTVTTQISTAITSIEAIKSPFRDAISSDRDTIQTAITALEELHTTLESEVIPLFDTN